MAEFTRPYLYEKQLNAMYTPMRWSLIEASTKSGKTVGSMAWITEKALLEGKPGYNYWWVSPGYNQSDIAFRRLKQGLSKGSFHAFESPTPRIVLMSGATIWFKSGDNADALYGEDVYGAVIDEASRVREDCWHAVRSTLTATKGPARIIGNVKGRKNWFFNLARKAESGTPNMYYAKITAVDAIEAGIISQEELEDAKQTLPEAIFRELYFAEPSDDFGNPFGLDHIRNCLIGDLGCGPVVAWGIDLAKSRDYFVAVGLNAQGEVCGFSRWKGVPWRDSIRRVWAMVGEDTPCLVDSTGVGDPVLEELQHEHGNFHGFHFSQTSKQKLMEGLAVSLQSQEIKFPDGQIRIELENFEYNYSKTGVKYAAIEGQHDDCVCALALARQMFCEVKPGENVMSYYAAANAKERLREASFREDADDVRPWRVNKDTIDPQVFDNELTALYNETLGAALAQTNAKRCAACGEPINGSATKISDGFDSWHPECAGRGPQITLRIDSISMPQEPAA